MTTCACHFLVLGLGWAVLTASTAAAQTPDFTYATNDNTITITGYTGPGGAVTIPGGIHGRPVTGIGSFAFASPPATRLHSVTIPKGVRRIAGHAFASLSGELRGVYFLGNAPLVETNAFIGNNSATAYYLAGTTGWGATFAGLPAELWDPQITHAQLEFHC